MYKKKRQIKTKLECPLCGSKVEIAVHDRMYYGYCEDVDEVPEEARLVGERTFGNGNTRVYYRFPGYVPHCSNQMCFLRSANRVFRSPEIAMEAWIEGTNIG